MDIRAEIDAIEVALRSRGTSVAALCRAAEIHQSQWQRWKRGEALPNMRTWQRVLDARVGLVSPMVDAAGPEAVSGVALERGTGS
ncbi:helix-turn-helix domain-containing protein [Zavarzinia sp.]|uniref:helix-turn-helix domain-containing protein n=1 Tax=Zavarzinia sp. TaxID=2027920 RepID=UPI003BB5CB1B